MEHAHTDTDTLVSLPAIVRTGPKPAEYIIPQDVQMCMDQESSDIPAYTSVRMIERRAQVSRQTQDPLTTPTFIQ